MTATETVLQQRIEQLESDARTQDRVLEAHKTWAIRAQTRLYDINNVEERYKKEEWQEYLAAR